MRAITKDVFMNFSACPVLSWRTRRGDILEEPSVSKQFLMTQGREIHLRARVLFGEGRQVTPLEIHEAAAVTQLWMSEPGTQVLFEPAFIHGEFITRADILEREEEGWHLYEIKSGTGEKKEYLADMAYTYGILERCGVPLTGATLVHIDKEYRLGMEDARLFGQLDRSEIIRQMVDEMVWDELEVVTGSPDMPAPAINPACRSCAHFTNCFGNHLVHTVLDLPRIHASKLKSLSNMGIRSIYDIPSNFPLSERQELVWKSVRSHSVWRSPDFKSKFGEISFPAYYLDFETTAAAVPLFLDTAPHKVQPIQYSIHYCSSPGVVDQHFEYLADHRIDSRRILADRLVADLGNNGSILVYTGFEERVIRGLIELFPEMKDVLEAVIDRFVDLEALIRHNFYHPDFHGKTSIKTTLPALVPELSYDALPVNNGLDASAIFAMMMQGKYVSGEIMTLRRDMLAYCKMDTLAMVRLHERLLEYANN